MGAWEIATGATALAAAASGGAFLPYSTFTSAAVASLPDREGLRAMQAINVEAPRSGTFMALVFGTGALAAVVGVRAVLDSGPGTWWIVGGTLVYVIGVVGMTAGYHIPRNNALDTLDAAAFPAWMRSWVRGNHVRTVGGLLAGALIGIGVLAAA
ncbi:conserved hypothetical protein [Beutenbergia cavernae DSM 12333]|uniref:Integral membrane protein n=1 Tax=Beutenbergia cavernae (strain ATCC BAA-8 / DSM 12333 / CCUG 43141 / JCM 11478 / NBRC 16432 / NCIMB 13614 / HKI 0122) TaxID=471853 RepID=C5BVZ5_BEUC1|nr:anthrone oxygenase family protein [Beutenbergia cavernae]ACQ80596.1 conserved hypothetical protein [Beutenbergia cavernae DSM 12333]